MHNADACPDMQVNAWMDDHALSWPLPPLLVHGFYKVYGRQTWGTLPVDNQRCSRASLPVIITCIAVRVKRLLEMLVP